MSCKREGQTIPILASCLNLNKKQGKLGEEFIIKNCSEALGANVTVYKLGRVGFPEFIATYRFESKTDSAIISWNEVGKYEVQLQANNGKQASYYSPFAKDTITVID
jgi:hypothetical protein